MEGFFWMVMSVMNMADHLIGIGLSFNPLRVAPPFCERWIVRAGLW